MKWKTSKRITTQPLKVFRKLEEKIPPGAYELLEPLLERYPLQIRISRKRNTKAGDYRPPFNGAGHRISVNHDLQPPAFLLTLLHELAHLFTFEEYGRKAKPHGKEWKSMYRHVVVPFLAEGIFPGEVARPLGDYIRNPSASTVSHTALHRALYPHAGDGTRPIEEVPANGIFSINSGRRFRKVGRLRKNIKCLCLDNNKYYLFKPVAQVIPERQ
jgi:hypothetical protein